MSFNLLIHEDGLRSKELEKARTTFNERIAALQNRRAEIEGILATVHNTQRHLLTSAQLAKAHDQKVSAVDCLREEYLIRHELKESYFPLLQQARHEASERAREKYVAAAHELEEALVKVGYVKGNIPETNIIGITPDMIGRHPGVHKLFVQSETASSFAMHSPEIGTNNEAMKTLGEQIDKAVTALTRT